MSSSTVKKALLIGINYTSTPSISLRGCIDDVVNMRNVLIDAFGYTQNNIIMLRDDSSSAGLLPTKANIISALNTIVAGSNSNQEIWIHYSGHGSQIRDNSNTSRNGLDDIIVPLDYQRNGFITDIQINNIIKSIQCRAFIIFDSCNSGTISDFPWVIQYVSPTSTTKTQINNSQISNPNIFVFSSCKDNQNSLDIYDSVAQQYEGDFTDAFISTLRNNNYNVDILTFYNNVCQWLQQNKFTQNPVLTCPVSTPSYTITRFIPSGYSNVQPSSVSNIVSVSNTNSKKSINNNQTPKQTIKNNFRSLLTS